MSHSSGGAFSADQPQAFTFADSGSIRGATQVSLSAHAYVLASAGRTESAVTQKSLLLDGPKSTTFRRQ